MDNLVLEILELLIAIVILLFTRYGVPFINTQIHSAKYAKILSFVSVAVKSAEQLYALKEKSGVEKKEYSIEMIKTFADKVGLDMDEKTIEALVESAVKDLELAKKQ